MVAAVLLVGCGSTASPAGPGTTASGAPTGSGTAAGSPDPAVARLAAAVQALEAGYDFDATVTLNGVTATEAKGRWIGGASQFVLTSSGRSVTYRSVPPNAWVQQGDGSWVATQGPLPAGDPLAAFAAPLTVLSVSLPSASAPAASPSSTAGPAEADLTATYAPSVLGLSGSSPVAVTIHLGGDGSMAVTYATTTSAGPATSTTTFSPTTDTTPILAPGATPAPST